MALCKDCAKRLILPAVLSLLLMGLFLVWHLTLDPAAMSRGEIYAAIGVLYWGAWDLTGRIATAVGKWYYADDDKHDHS